MLRGPARCSRHPKAKATITWGRDEAMSSFPRAGSEQGAQRVFGGALTGEEKKPGGWRSRERDDEPRFKHWPDHSVTAGKEPEAPLRAKG